MKNIIITSDEPLENLPDHELTISEGKYVYKIIDEEGLPLALDLPMAMRFVKNKIGNKGSYELKQSYNDLVTKLKENDL